MKAFRSPVVVLICLAMLPLEAETSERDVEVALDPVQGAIGYQVQVSAGEDLQVDKRFTGSPIHLTLPAGIFKIRVAAVNKFGRIAKWTEWRELRVGLPAQAIIASAEIEPTGSVIVVGNDFQRDTKFDILQNGRRLAARAEILEAGRVRVFPENPLLPGTIELVATNEDSGAAPSKFSLLKARPATVASAEIEPTGSVLIRGSDFKSDTKFTLLRDGNPLPARVDILGTDRVRVIPEQTLPAGNLEISASNADATESPSTLAFSKPREIEPSELPAKQEQTRAEPQEQAPSRIAWLIPGLPAFRAGAYGKAAGWSSAFAGLLLASGFTAVAANRESAAFKNDFTTQVVSNPLLGFGVAQVGGSAAAIPVLFLHQQAQASAHSAYNRYRTMHYVTLAGALGVFGAHAYLNKGTTASVSYAPDEQGGRWVAAVRMEF